MKISPIGSSYLGHLEKPVRYFCEGSGRPEYRTRNLGTKDRVMIPEHSVPIHALPFRLFPKISHAGDLRAAPVLLVAYLHTSSEISLTDQHR